MGFGPTTSTLARLRSTPELYPQYLANEFTNNIKKIKCKNFFSDYGIFFNVANKMLLSGYMQTAISYHFCVNKVLF